jgi:hypothetical protein
MGTHAPEVAVTTDPPKKKAAPKEVAVKEVAALPAEFMDELSSDAEEFRVDYDQADIALPFLSILQKSSPQCDADSSKYVEGAKPGMLFNNVAGEGDNLIDPATTPLYFIKVNYKRCFIEWVPRAAGGGFVNEYTVPLGEKAVTVRSEQSLDIIQPTSPIGVPGNQLSDTHTHFVFVLGADGAIEPALLSMTATQLKYSRKWNSLESRVMIPGKNVRAPSFFTIWKIGTKREENEKGSWYSWTFERAGDVLEPVEGVTKERMMEVYHEAKRFAEASNERSASQDYKADEAGMASDDDDDQDNEVPF